MLRSVVTQRAAVRVGPALMLGAVLLIAAMASPAAAELHFLKDRRARPLAALRAAAVEPRPGVTLEDLRARLRASERVQRVEDDTPIAIFKSPDDPGVSEHLGCELACLGEGTQGL